MAGEQEKAVSAVLAGAAANIAQNALIVLPMNPTIIVCLLCIVFMWLESVVGYCVGCHIYKWLVTK
jgi:mannose/fructose/N-acetylgalactosamine-specific phosphotransferase system component IID